MQASCCKAARKVGQYAKLTIVHWRKPCFTKRNIVFITCMPASACHDFLLPALDDKRLTWSFSRNGCPRRHGVLPAIGIINFLQAIKQAMLAFSCYVCANRISHSTMRAMTF
jgi:hypothetical protein